MLTTSLPLLPPPTTSLLPPLHSRPNAESSSTSDGQGSLQAQQQQRRARGHPHTVYPRSELAMLSYDERILAQRKLAIQMYGYSWLKPAGCTKTMLGRREEELERDEVERQLREVEMQERNQAEADEAERQTHLGQQRAAEARGEDVGEEGERDLDDEVPDMDAEQDFEDEDSDGEEDDGEVDLDNDIPEGDSGWLYHTTRDPDTESEAEPPSSSLRLRSPPQPRANVPGNRQGTHRLDQERVQQHEMSDAMLDEDEMSQYAHEDDLDDDVPDMDASLQDLDDDVPDADDDGGWEHTDTELEESDMDISIMPPGVTAHQLSMPPPYSNVHQRQQSRLSARQSNASEQSDMSSSMRRTSGNVPLPMGPPAQPLSARGGRRGLPRTQLPPNFTPDQLGSDLSISALISTGNTDMHSDNRSAQDQRSWLNPASARRNLFGRNSNAPAQPVGASLRIVSAQQLAEGVTENIVGSRRQVSSGGLFTPSPQHQDLEVHQLDGTSGEEPRSRTRSGRVISANRARRRA